MSSSKPESWAYLIIHVKDGVLTSAFIAGSDHQHLTRKYDGSVMATAMSMPGATYDEASRKLREFMESNHGAGMGFDSLLDMIKKAEGD